MEAFSALVQAPASLPSPESLRADPRPAAVRAERHREAKRDGRGRGPPRCAMDDQTTMAAMLATPANDLGSIAATDAAVEPASASCDRQSEVVLDSRVLPPLRVPWVVAVGLLIAAACVVGHSVAQQDAPWSLEAAESRRPGDLDLAGRRGAALALASPALAGRVGAATARVGRGRLGDAGRPPGFGAPSVDPAVDAPRRASSGCWVDLRPSRPRGRVPGATRGRAIARRTRRSRAPSRRCPRT